RPRVQPRQKRVSPLVVPNDRGVRVARNAEVGDDNRSAEGREPSRCTPGVAARSPELRPRENRSRFFVMTNLLAIIPLALVMVTGPQIVSATLLATSENARRASLSYILGVASGTTLGVAIVYLVAKAAGASPRSSQTS